MNIKTLIFGIYLALFSLNLFAQPLVDDSKTYEVLVFENIQKEQTKFIRSGGHIKYSLYSNPKIKYKGTLQKVTSNAIFVDGQEIKLSDCNMIAGRVRTSKEIIGGMMLGMGSALAPFGAAIISSNNIAGPSIIGGGAVLIGVGIYFITQKKNFKMTKGWTVHGGKINFSQTLN
jgi:hypothetical protein